MILLDRHIMARFLGNFVLLFGLLFIFAISIDVVVQFDEFLRAAEMVAERDSRWYPLVFIEGWQTTCSLIALAAGCTSGLHDAL